MMRAEADGRIALAINLELSHGRHGASARVELLPGERRGARLSLRGWIDDIAMRRLATTLEDLGRRGIGELALDCSKLLNVDHGVMPRLLDAIAAYESAAGPCTVAGLSVYLRERFRFAGAPFATPTSVLEPCRGHAS